jgi:hypothetical protein
VAIGIEGDPHRHLRFAAAVSSIQSIDGVQMVRPGLGEIFPGMGARCRQGAEFLATLQALEEL